MNENKKLWFRNKKYGWGWVPVSKEGWLAVLVYIVLLAGGEVLFINKMREHSSKCLIAGYSLFVIIISALLIVISYKKGEKPEWRWGDKKDKNDPPPIG